MADEKRLTEKEEAFCQSYLIDFNGARAARAAGYSHDSARAIAAENLTKPHIQARIQEIRETTGKAFNITRERIAQELAKIAFSDLREVFEENGALKSPENWSDEIAGAIAGVEVDELFEGRGEDREMIGYTKKVKLWEKTKAIEALNKMFGFNSPEELHLIGKKISVTISDE